MRAILIGLVLSAFAFPALADVLRVSGVWIPLAPPNARAHAAYMTVENTSDSPITIVGVSAEGYRMAHLHQTQEQGGVSSMMSLHQITLTPGGRATFEPGGMHVMLMGPSVATEEGSIVPMVFHLENGAEVPLSAMVLRPENAALCTH